MSGDGKIGMQVGGIVRAAPLRKIASDGGPALAAPAASRGPAETLPAGRLLGLTAELAGQTPPVDAGRVATLRAAIANGDYAVNPDTIARAIVDFHRAGAA